MQPRFAIVGAKANLEGEAPFGDGRSELRLSYEFMRLARVLWPRKTAAELAYRTGVSERAAEFWLAGKYAISLEHARKLIQSDEGKNFLVPFIGDARPAWWLQMRRTSELSDLRKSQDEARRRIERLELDL